jgi:RimJ/RimL family protein N-acetyltransferase
VGSIGFFGPPEPAADGVPEVEVGYGLVEDARGAGVATEALTAMLGAAESAGARVRASVLPDNAASIRVLAKCGFTELRGSNEDGELVLARPLRG